ncbi:MAG: FAD-dependent oxidoreductase [Gammaproteobacteria bacterium]|nr:FAD-dependent oxidoreductase [Gammaproteobacteria bacterium]MCY4218863.1 FAD-dependent oxidoreductase [Gammaproteobacteria bacterium]MCY4274483.1 FAD-dependent oxidoreductase [Gammaproteobacteria bacterium]
MSSLPGKAHVVVVGGGIMGCSTTYHLARLGITDVILLERQEISSGSTWHAAGLVGQLRNQAGITQLLGHSVDLYKRLEQETGQAAGWKMNGGLRLACNSERMMEIKRQATTANSFGLDMQILTPKEAQTLWPLMNIDDVIGAAYLPTDGQTNPSDITQALAKGSRERGVQIVENCAVTAVDVKEGRVNGLKTTKGTIEVGIVVNCCGQWAREFGILAGVNVPLISVQHQYLITEPIAGVTSNLPTLRDPDRLTYYKEEVGGLIMGGYEPNPIAWAEDGLPDDFRFTLLDPDWDHFEPMMALALPRLPALGEVGIKQLINGPESFTPDGNFILGEAPEVRGYFVGAGFNAFGIAAGGGAGKALAEWIVADEPPYDLWAVDIRRFGSVHRNRKWIQARTLELYGKHYTIAWPSEEHNSARGARQSPLYENLRQRGACFGEKMGWERPNWFAPSGVIPEDHYSFDRPNWFEYVSEEHRAVRERVAIMDQTSFAKFEIRGSDAGPALNRICAANVDCQPMQLRYTQMLNSRGGIECDLTVSRLAPDHFYIVTGTGFITHDRHWIESHFRSGESIHLEDVSDRFAVLSLMGPKSRSVLKTVAEGSFENADFPFSSVRHIQIQGRRVLAARVTYVGELGWELHCRREDATQIYQTLMEAGFAHGIADAGYRAIETLRLEKAYRAWGTDLTPDHTPLEAGLGFAVKLGTSYDFTGRQALEKQLSNPLTKRLMGFSINSPEISLIGRETIYRDGERVGWLTSGGYGHTVDCAIGLGYVRNPNGVQDDWLDCGTYELEIATQRIPAKLHRRAFYDPDMTRVKV